MRINKPLSIVSLALLASIPVLSQASITVDGNIGDWLDSDFTQENSDWDPTRATTSYVVSDYDSNDQSYTTSSSGINHSKTSNPYGDNQIYDAEAMYIEIQNDTLYIAIVSGLAPTNKYFSGDIFFDLDGDIGTSGGTGYEFGLVVDDHYPNAVSSDGYWDPGQLVNFTSWQQGLNGTDLHPVTGDDGTLITDAETQLGISPATDPIVGIGANGDNDEHYIIEASISLGSASNRNVFGQSLLDSLGHNGNDINIHWNPSCNNDWIQYTGSLAYNTNEAGNPGQIPEPTPLALMAIGLLGILARRRIS
ncbi:MAG: PEP-CTERM sorting domain-containing protein [gamma proteobacterium symbiont of Bathyaustriella thionipta]|nr:PEP-CTERM sorting domain-containing protein [gamma proteobacterium symbiont of Bathyaustriella thionipta]MCU7949111.1 PEP-CTERM sorting domain-containing protein [gamma proteobacterium symbiont of Bathyaustriella thionipta]MCU7954422.1 PEP-CTERM sorting domain-containing protein [gamma proteobacterium symbiont of Bathyaustriella thionipta]MCU7955716.1 PEP-CTERM sorting domain-containing protein [gamma proteobacterium symbiont of Bathyaustriella thionipta]MCU7966190.1 PEP-CTERM sorting domain